MSCFGHSRTLSIVVFSSIGRYLVSFFHWKKAKKSLVSFVRTTTHCLSVLPIMSWHVVETINSKRAVVRRHHLQCHRVVLCAFLRWCECERGPSSRVWVLSDLTAMMTIQSWGIGPFKRYTQPHFWINWIQICHTYCALFEKESWSFQKAAWPLRKELTGMSFSHFRFSGEPEGDQPPAS